MVSALLIAAVTVSMVVGYWLGMRCRIDATGATMRAVMSSRGQTEMLFRVKPDGIEIAATYTAGDETFAVTTLVDEKTATWIAERWEARARTEQKP